MVYFSLILIFYAVHAQVTVDDAQSTRPLAEQKRCNKAQWGDSSDDEVLVVGDGESGDDEDDQVRHLVRHHGEEVERRDEGDDTTY